MQPLDKVVALALKLSPIDRVKLIERLMPTLEEALTEDHEPDEVELANNLREAWHDAMTEKTYPIESLWEMVDDEQSSN
jgi:hypothetical protein